MVECVRAVAVVVTVVFIDPFRMGEQPGGAGCSLFPLTYTKVYVRFVLSKLLLFTYYHS